MMASPVGGFRVAVLALLVMFASAGAFAGVFHVDQLNGDDANDGLGWSTAFATVKAAIDAASLTTGRDTIKVAAGTYTESLVAVSEISLLGGYPPAGGARDLRNQTTILNGDGWTVLRLDGVSDVTIDGLTVRDGRGGSHGSAGINVRLSVGVALRDLVVVENRSSEYCSAEFVPPGGCTLQWPEPNPIGTGLLATDSELDIENVLFASNSVSYSVSEDPECAGGCTNVGIAPSYASTVYLLDCTGTMNNVTVADNRCYTEIAYCASTVGIRGGNMVVTDSIFFANAAEDYRFDNPDASYSNIATGNFNGVGNLSQTPLFATGSLGDYYLSQATAGQPVDSPCLNAGSRSAATAGLDRYTTSTGETGDIGAVDMGFHYPRGLAISCDLAAGDMLALDDPGMHYTSSCSRVDPAGSFGRRAVTVPSVAPGATFDTASPGVAGDLTLYQLECGCDDVIFITKDASADKLVLDF